MQLTNVDVSPILVRQNPITTAEWVDLIKFEAEKVRPLLNKLTLSTLRTTGILWDDYSGTHSLNEKMKKYEVLFIGAGPDFQAIFPPEDERVSSNEFSYLAEDTSRERPIYVVQKLWALTRAFEWVTIEVRSELSYIEDPPHINRFCTPKEVEVKPACLDGSFWEFTGLTPKKFFYRFLDSIECVLRKREEFWRELAQFGIALKHSKSQLSLIPGGAYDHFE
jgi:hypothetical protein